MILALTTTSALCMAAEPGAVPTPPVESSPAASASTSKPTDATLRKRGKRFAKLDINKDEFVDREEFKKAMPNAKKPDRVEKRFSRMDGNRDDKVSKTEWLAAERPRRKASASVRSSS